MLDVAIKPNMMSVSWISAIMLITITLSAIMLSLAIMPIILKHVLNLSVIMQTAIMLY